ncbi:CAAX amino terminal protease self- immunity [Rosistilla ulvae]|uniref:CAAX amino terminal protease self-immunity n=1 Tax=Rosistilla ulvae TaxID=1930277 RepID=A0A517M158_9BACT|nr:CPBP family intramembrane glutamic endopeptidase [Rosistilla ulvae]QDS88596.1 CAAX amino terminal protease self- immunity [Rosistilla ulvae]
MSPLEIFSAVFGLFALAMVFGSLFTWSLGLRRLWQGGEFLPLERRTPVGWGVDGVIVSLGLVVLLANAASFIAQRGGWLELPEDPQKTPISLSDMSTLLTLEGGSRVLACGLVILWLVALYRSSALDLGFALRWSHLTAGLVGVVALLPPIYLLQALLTLWWVEYEHPVLELLQESGDPIYLLPMAMVAVVVAPLTEEFLFRVVLQGWLESKGMKDASPAGDSSGHVGMDAGASTYDGGAPSGEGLAGDGERSTAPDRTVPYWPILVSSLFFALAHLGHGPAPVTLFFLALGLGYLYRQTHSIWPSLMVHFCLNAITMIVAAVSMMLGEGL